ncbi:crosslink repair DNA glycosylase YcaQ family protein [Verrucomicrobium spinosum]|uniref:crosslink repair DNA glycosylase YcaQ family protein n=1 Tax=Verrucomicrobium spinosum TaxID=2736 RepID=UPI000A61C6E7|nr:crosslink repair DNA glycosylase YcaQ family protein [Verrucomicrobium spinosum]
MTAPLTLSLPEARRFHCKAVLLSARVPDVAAALRHHGYIQIDPINVCGRMQDLILRNRVQGYREGDLFRFLHGSEKARLPTEERQAFEHHLPHTHILVALPLEAWPYLLATMRHRTGTDSTWSGKLDDRESKLAGRILARWLSGAPWLPMMWTMINAPTTAGAARPRWPRPLCRSSSSMVAS